MPSAGLCERVVLNKDALRERCGIPELQANKLRKVSFCVDVEVAPCNEDLEARKEARRKRREAKEKEKERLKLLDGTPEAPTPPPNVDSASGAAEAAAPQKEAAADNLGDEEGNAEKLKPRRRVHPKPTTDPMKIYTQCCQLRETKILPVVQEQLRKENCPAVLMAMDLTGYKFQMADAVTFADFLALVPIKRLILEDCDLTDEIVRMVLSALSAVRPIPEGGDRPAESRENSIAEIAEKHHRGAIERLSFKKNPKIGRDGWKYISCFVHMSHTLKALDVSQVTLTGPAPTSPKKLGHFREYPGTDPTTLLSKSLKERLCGHGLEELVMGHCGLNSVQIGILLDGITKGGTMRLGLEGNDINDDGLAMIGRWMKPGIQDVGVCEALDLSNNNIRVCRFHYMAT